MLFEENKYLSWYIPRIQDKDDVINLHSSGVSALLPAEINMTFNDPWTAIARFETQLAQWLDISPQEILFTPGATGGTLLALLTLADPRKHIIMEYPIYEPMARQAHRICQVNRLIRRPGQEWRIPLEKAAQFVNKETSLIVITEPHNPSGRFASSEEVLTLAEIAAESNALLIVNEVYRGYSNRPSYHGMADNIIVVSSFSKLLGSYWARIGWLSGPEQIIARLRKGHLNMGMGNSTAAEIGLAVLQQAPSIQAKARHISQKGLAIVDKWVQNSSNINWLPPEGPGFGSIMLPQDTDDIALANYLHEEHKVLCIPGTYFDTPETLRLSWIQAENRLEEGLEIVSTVLKSENFHSIE